MQLRKSSSIEATRGMQTEQACEKGFPEGHHAIRSMGKEHLEIEEGVPEEHLTTPVAATVS